MSRLFIRPCPECRKSFSGSRQLKYCSDPCRAAAAKKQRAEYERRVKRPPHLYRKKKTVSDEIQLELALDTPRTEPYKKAP